MSNPTKRLKKLEASFREAMNEFTTQQLRNMADEEFRSCGVKTYKDRGVRSALAEIIMREITQRTKARIGDEAP